MAESSASAHHPTGGGRRKGKSPPGQPQLPDLPPAPQGGGLSEDTEEEKDAKRPRSSSTTPKSGRGLEPYEYDRLMGAPSVGSTSEQLGTVNALKSEKLEKNLNLASLMTPFQSLSLILVLGRVRGELQALGSWKS